MTWETWSYKAITLRTPAADSSVPTAVTAQEDMTSLQTTGKRQVCTMGHLVQNIEDNKTNGLW